MPTSTEPAVASRLYPRRFVMHLPSENCYQQSGPPVLTKFSHCSVRTVERVWAAGDVAKVHFGSSGQGAIKTGAGPTSIVRDRMS